MNIDVVFEQVEEHRIHISLMPDKAQEVTLGNLRAKTDMELKAAWDKYWHRYDVYYRLFITNPSRSDGADLMRQVLEDKAPDAINITFAEYGELLFKAALERGLSV